MEFDNKKKGLIWGVAGIFLIGFQPIVANARPPDIFDNYIFAAMTCFFEALIFFPLMFVERKRIKTNYKKGIIVFDEMEKLLYGYKKNLPMIFFIGLIFGVGNIMFFTGYQLAGSINGSIAQKSTVIFSLLFGYLITKERITKKQIVFSLILLFGLVIAVSQGNFNLIDFNMGVIIILLLSCIWMMAHAGTKPIFSRKEATTVQMVFMRNIIGFAILFSTYWIFFPLENIAIFFDPVNYFWFFAMGGAYVCGLYCWYNVLSNLDVSKATIMTSPTPIATALFATLILNEIFTIYHLIGLIIVIPSIIMIVRERDKTDFSKRIK